MKLLSAILLLPAFPLACLAGTPPAVAWTKDYGVGKTVATDCSHQFIAADDSIITVGYGPVTGSVPELQVWKHSPGGTLKWLYHTNGTPVSAVLDSAGFLYINAAPALIKIDPLGSEVWRKSGADAGEMAIDGAGGIYSCGTVSGSAGTDISIVKYSAAGEVVWSRRFDGAAHEDDAVRKIAGMPDGGVTVTGSVSMAGGEKRVLTVRYQSDGSPAWADIYDVAGVSQDAGRDIACDAQGNVTVAGAGLKSTTSGDTSHVTLLRYDAAGARQWTHEYVFDPFSIEPGTYTYVNVFEYAGMALDGTGRACIAGRSKHASRGPLVDGRTQINNLLITVTPEGARERLVKVSSAYQYLVGDDGSRRMKVVRGLQGGGFLTGGAWLNAARALALVDSAGEVQWTVNEPDEMASPSFNAQISVISIDSAGHIITATSHLAAPQQTYGSRTHIQKRGGTADPPDEPSAQPAPADQIEWNSARLNGTISSTGFPGKWHFIYGLTTDYGSRGPDTSFVASPAFPASWTALSLLGGSTYHFRIVIETSQGTFFSDDRTFTTLLSPYQSWAAQKFGTHTGPESAMNANPDGDAYSNLMECAFNGDPLSQDAPPGLPVPEVTKDPDSGFRYLSITWEENPSAGLLYEPEASSNLSAWTGASSGEIVIETLPGSRKRAIAAGFQKYLRLRIRQAP